MVKTTTAIQQVMRDSDPHFASIDDLLRHFKVKSFKGLDSGVAIRKAGMWRYYSLMFDGAYHLTGTTLRLAR